MDWMSFTMGVLAGLLVSGVAGAYALSRLRRPSPERYVRREAYDALEVQSDVLRADLAEKEEEIRSLSARYSAKEQVVLHLEEKVEGQQSELERMHRQMEERFANLAERLLEEKSRKFAAMNQDQLSGILTPFREKFKAFEEQMEKRHWEEAKERISLQKEIEQLRDLNVQLSSDANNLVNALKGDNRSQGDWGEMQLETLLQRAGLEKGVHYDTQQTFRRETGRRHRPDFIIHLPDEKQLVIDAKVSLKAYEAFFQAEDPAEKKRHLRAHLASIRNHIRELAAKDYANIYQINSPDYLLMYMPIEPALTEALQEDGQLFLEALDRNVVLVSNSTLLATMRTVSFIWKQEKQKRNVLEIARQSGLLYDRFCSFSEDLRDIGRRLRQAQGAYDNALRKFSDSTKYGDTLVGRAERIRQLGAKASKQLPEEFKAPAGKDKEE